MKTTVTAILATLVAVPLTAQGTLRAAASTRATVEAAVAAPRAEGAPAPTPLKIRIDYGQPHARGRAVEGALKADLDTVWRLGANEATTLSTDADLAIGSASVPRGNYSLYARTSSTGAWQLIINQNTGQWGTEYLRDKDLVRVPLTTRSLPASTESLSITLVPAGDGSPRGDLRITWGTREFSTTWAVK